MSLSRRTTTRAFVLLLALVLGPALVAVPVSAGAEDRGEARRATSRVTLVAPGPHRFVPGATTSLSGTVGGPGRLVRPLVVEQRRGDRWVAVARDRTYGRERSYYVTVRLPDRAATVTWRVVVPRTRVAPRGVSRSVTVRTLAQRMTWQLPATARVGSLVRTRIGLRPYVPGAGVSLEQEVSGRWQRVVRGRSVGRGGTTTIAFTQITQGPSRFRLTGPDGLRQVRTLRGTPTDVVLPTRRLSTTSNGSQTNGSAQDASSSDDGRYVAFTSDASNAVPGDTNDRLDVFVKDTLAGRLTRVAHGPRRVPANGSSLAPAVSGDGRFVAFVSRATNLVPGNRYQPAVFVWERATGEITRVADLASGPDLSRDGRYVAYSSGGDIFVRDRTSATTTRVTHGDGPSLHASISADGRYVAFDTAATNQTPEATAGVVLWDRVTATRTLVAARGSRPRLSADGSVLAWVQDGQVHRRDLASGVTTQVSTGTGEDDTAATSLDALSADGSVVLFSSAAALVPDDVDDEGCPSEGECYYYENFTDAYVWRASTGEVEMASRSTTGAASDYQSLGQDLLADGSGAVFLSRSVLVPGQSDRGGYFSVHGFREVFVRDLG